MFRSLWLPAGLADEDLVKSTGLFFGLTRRVVTLPDFPPDLPKPYEPYEPYEEPVPDPPHERRDVEPYEDDEPCVAGPPYCERPAPYEDDPYEERDHREPEPYEEP